MKKWALITQDSGEKTWLTPPSIIEALGHFDTDPCVPDEMPWKTADRMITKAEDGRAAEWTGRVWLNPPYGREAVPFMRRMATYTGGASLSFSHGRTRPSGKTGFSRSQTLFFSFEDESSFAGRTGRSRRQECRLRPLLSPTLERTRKRYAVAGYPARSSV